MSRQHDRKGTRQPTTAKQTSNISSKVAGATGPPPPGRMSGRMAMKFGFAIVVLTLFWANTILYETLTTPGKVNLHHKLTGELTMTITKTVLYVFMFIQCLLLLMCGVCGMSRCFKNIAAFLKITTVFSIVYASITYYTLRTQQNRYQVRPCTTSTPPRLLYHPHYYSCYLLYPTTIPDHYMYCHH